MPRYRDRLGPELIFSILGEPSRVFNFCSDHKSKLVSWNCTFCAVRSWQTPSEQKGMQAHVWLVGLYSEQDVYAIWGSNHISVRWWVHILEREEQGADDWDRLFRIASGEEIWRFKSGLDGQHWIQRDVWERQARCVILRGRLLWASKHRVSEDSYLEPEGRRSAVAKLVNDFVSISVQLLCRLPDQ